MNKRFHTTKDTGVIMGTHYKLYKDDEFICYVFDDRIYPLLDILNKQDERIQELETKNRNAEHLINILEQNKLENMGSSLNLFTENAKLKAKINELEEMVTDD